jgi:hypothetical protein
MADIAINKSNAKRYLNGSIPPSSPNTIDGEPVPPSSIVGGGEWVPYLGAKDEVDLGEYFLKASHLKLKTDLATIPTDQGSIYWDEDEETIAVILNGSTTKVGEDIFFQVKNQSGATIPKGTAVRFDGVVGASGRVKIVPFLANGSNPSIYFLGVTYEAIANGADGKALFNGKIRGVNTSAFAVGDILYASPTVAGGFTTTKPIAPNNIISVAAVLSSGANGILLIRPQIGSNINNDEGVKITTPTTGDILQLQASGLWENKSRLAAGLITGSGTLNRLAKFTAAGTVGNSQVFDNGTNVGIGTDSPVSKLDIRGITNISAINNTTNNEVQFLRGSINQETSFGVAIGIKVEDEFTNRYSLLLGTQFNEVSGITTKMTITGSGNVGIGTTSPASIVPGTNLTINGTTGGYSSLFLQYNNVNKGFFSATSTDLLIGSAGDLTNMLFFTGDTERLRITSGGNVGIGTDSPANQLTIVGNYPSQVSIEASSGNTNSQINLKPNGSGIAYIKNQANTDFAFGTNNTERLRITSGGNLLINTDTDAGFRLDVNGSLRANTRVNFASLPTSSSGLVSGDLWRNGTVINIIP